MDWAELGDEYPLTLAGPRSTQVAHGGLVGLMTLLARRRSDWSRQLGHLPAANV